MAKKQAKKVEVEEPQVSAVNEMIEVAVETPKVQAKPKAKKVVAVKPKKVYGKTSLKSTRGTLDRKP